MIDADRMAAIDRNAEALGISRQQLMESSGNAVARRVKSEVDTGSTVQVVAGRGNNGGDGFAAARFLQSYDCRVTLVGHPERIHTSIARANWEALQQTSIPTDTVSDSRHVAIESPDMIIDAMLGSGVRGPLREPVREFVRSINQAETPVLSVDVPTGMDPDTGEITDIAVNPSEIITFHKQKSGLEAVTAPVTVADIGIPAAAEEFVGPGDLLRLGRSPQSHKGDSGKILIIGGGPYAGAPALSAQAALRAGADLVSVACPSSVAETVQAYSENLIIRPLKGKRLSTENETTLQDLASEQDIVLIGPGLGNHAETMNAVESFLNSFNGTAVVDADALDVVGSISTSATHIYTPHQGEFARMGGDPQSEWRERKSAVKRLATELGQTILVKGMYDIIASDEMVRVNRTGNSGMTVGGTGDVLAGITAAFACVLDPLSAASVATYVNGRAGDRVAESRGVGIHATDIIDEISKIRQEATD